MSSLEGKYEDYSDDPNVLAEVASGELTALIMFVDESVMQTDPGPLIHQTLDETRVLVTLNKNIFDKRVEMLAYAFHEKSGADLDDLRRRCTHELATAMLGRTLEVLDEYYAVNGIGQLGDKGD